MARTLGSPNPSSGVAVRLGGEPLNVPALTCWAVFSAVLAYFWRYESAPKPRDAFLHVDVEFVVWN